MRSRSRPAISGGRNRSRYWGSSWNPRSRTKKRGARSWELGGKPTIASPSSPLPAPSSLPRLRVLHILVEPAQLLVGELLVRLHRRIPVRLVRQHDETGYSAVAADGLIEHFGLERCGARVGVVGAVDDEQGSAHLVGEEVRRDFEVGI